MERWKSIGGLSQRRVRKKKEDQRGERVRRKKKGRKVAKHRVFPMFCGPGGSKSRLAKAAVAHVDGAMSILKSKC